MTAPDRRWATPLRAATVSLVCAALAACSATEPVKMDGSNSSTHGAVLPAGTLNGAQTMQALSEQSFAFVLSGMKGSVTFHGDGTLSYRSAVAGEGTGMWQASDGGLCQTLNPTHFLPQGVRTTCYAFISTGKDYRWGTAHYTPV